MTKNLFLEKIQSSLFLQTFLRLKKLLIFLILLSMILSLFTAFQSHMNNWLIFKQSFFHLLDGTSLYIHYPGEHNDLYKYSPTFALLMGPLAILPAWLGALFWNLIGTALFIFAIIGLPISDWQRQGVIWISLPEFIGSTQGFQSNIHMVALLLIFWIYLEENKAFKASLSIWTSFFIKIFGIVAGSLFLFSEYSFKDFKKLGFHILMLSFVLLLFAFLPAAVIGWDSLVFQYSEWARLLKMDAAQSYGFSIMGIIHGFTGWNFDRLPWQLAGGLSLIFSFLYFSKTDQEGRMLGLIALCYFMVLFNHKSESPTFIIAMVAFALHQSLMRNRKLRWCLIVFTLGCVSLLYSDLFRSFKQSHFDVYCVKAWPFVLLYPMALFQTGRQKINFI